MSGRLVSAVLESGLPAWVKPYAVALASFAADDGSRVYPSRRRIANMVGRSERRTRAALSHLRAIGILEVIEPAGPARTTTYHFHGECLPLPPDRFGQLSLSLAPPKIGAFAQAKAQLPSGKPTFPQFAQTFGGRARPLMGAAGVPRSVVDPCSSNRGAHGARDLDHVPEKRKVR